MAQRSHEKTGSRGTWSKPFSFKSPIQGGATLECVAMEERGLFKLPLVESQVAHHLQPGFGKGYGHHGGAGESASAQFIQALLPRARVQLLDVAVDPKGLFSPTMTTMQSRCEENKWEEFRGVPARIPDLQLNLRLRLCGSTNQLHQWISTEASKRPGERPKQST
ncbi:unnamed protein product [Gadus morhua 'NCC']